MQILCNKWASSSIIESLNEGSGVQNQENPSPGVGTSQRGQGGPGGQPRGKPQPSHHTNIKFYFAVGRPSGVLGHRNVHVQNQTQSRKDLHLNRLNAYETLVIFQEFNDIELMHMQRVGFHVW